MYAIIATGGKQYKVAEGDVIKVERLGAGAGETVTFDQVLVVNNGELQIEMCIRDRYDGSYGHTAPCWENACF